MTRPLRVELILQISKFAQIYLIRCFIELAITSSYLKHISLSLLTRITRSTTFE